MDNKPLSSGGRGANSSSAPADRGSEYEHRGDADAASVGDIVTNTYGIRNSGDATLSQLELTGVEVSRSLRLLYNIICVARVYGMPLHSF